MDRTQPPVAKGTPAPFTQEQVDALIRGKLAKSEITKILSSHQRATGAEARRRRKASPVALSGEDLARIVGGDQMPDDLVKRLEAAAKKRRRPEAKEATTRRVRPRKRPPL